jgi:hypothetical protein
MKLGALLAVLCAVTALAPARPTHATNLLREQPDRFTFAGDAKVAVVSPSSNEPKSKGIILRTNNKSPSTASVTVSLPDSSNRWFQFGIRLLASESFAQPAQRVILRASFAARAGAVPLDSVTRHLQSLIAKDLTDLRDPGTHPSLGSTTWRWYTLDFKTPFPEVDTVRLSLELVPAEGADNNPSPGTLLVGDWELTPIPAQPSAKDSTLRPEIPASRAGEMIPIGGRWHVLPEGASRAIPETFSHANAHRLLYLSENFEAPFFGNMDAWLRKGQLNREGKTATDDVYFPDNLTIQVVGEDLVLTSRGIPNHPTATFPDVERFLDGNPNPVQEKRSAFHLPLKPRQNASAIAMKDGANTNQALPPGPIGVANNGIVFFNPFDHILDGDAVWRLDRCCGHPSPRAQYHYHKYPVCLKTPWADEGEAHSPVIGFAFDGFPVCGPYESKGVLARESKSNPLNEFNLHEDPVRGPHYHVTPGRFPHIIGGFWGEVHPSLRERRPPPPSHSARPVETHGLRRPKPTRAT